MCRASVETSSLTPWTGVDEIGCSGNENDLSTYATLGYGKRSALTRVKT